MFFKVRVIRARPADPCFRCPNCGKLFPIFSGLQLHYQTCEVKPREPTKNPPKTSRKRKTRTSLNAAGVSTWQAQPEAPPEVKEEKPEEPKPEMSVKEKLLAALGLIQKTEKKTDEKPSKKLPIFIPEKCPTFDGDLGMFKFDLIETVDCSGRADYFQPPTDVKLEIREPDDLESPTPTPKPKPERAASKPKSSRTSNPRRTARNSNNSSPQVKEEPKEEIKKEQEPPPMPSPAKKVKKEPIQVRVGKLLF